MEEDKPPRKKMTPQEREKMRKENMERHILATRQEKRDECHRLDILLDSMKDMKRGVRGKVRGVCQVSPGVPGKNLSFS